MVSAPRTLIFSILIIELSSPVVSSRKKNNPRKELDKNVEIHHIKHKDDTGLRQSEPTSHKKIKKNKRRHQKKETAPTTRSSAGNDHSLYKFDELRNVPVLPGGPPKKINYKVQAGVAIKGKYEECPPSFEFSCINRPCEEVTCENLDAEDCPLIPITKCESSEWTCFCNNQNGWYRFNTSSSICVRKDDVRCQEMNTAGFEWVGTQPKNAESLSKRALIGGYELDNRTALWIMRTPYGGDLIPGKFIRNILDPLFGYNGRELRASYIEIFCADPEKVCWLPGKDGSIPPTAIIAGNTSDGEPLYVGRAKYLTSFTIGKVDPSKGMSISFGAKEFPCKNYQVLCRNIKNDCVTNTFYFDKMCT